MLRTDRLAHEDGVDAFVGLTMGLTVALRGIESEVLDLSPMPWRATFGSAICGVGAVGACSSTRQAMVPE